MSAVYQKTCPVNGIMGEVEVEGRAFSDGAGHPYLTAVCIDDCLGDGQVSDDLDVRKPFSHGGPGPTSPAVSPAPLRGAARPGAVIDPERCSIRRAPKRPRRDGRTVSALAVVRGEPGTCRPRGLSLVAVVGSSWSNYLALPGLLIGPTEDPDLH